MQFAVSVHQRHPFDNQFLTSEFVTDFARAAESAGFGALFWTEHPAPSDEWLASGGHDAPDPFVALAFAAAVTTKLKLLTNLTVVPYRNPFMLAKTAATLDRVSNGRLILGTGTGYLEGEYDALGVPLEDRNARFDEALDVLRLAWSGRSVQYSSSRFNAAGNTSVPTPVQDPLPIWIGGNSKLTLRRVAEKAQGWMPLPNPRSLGNRRRSAHLETLDDLSALLAYLHEQRAHFGRTDPLDIAYVALDGGVLGTSGFDPAGFLRGVEAVAPFGVTWIVVSIVTTSHAAAVDAVGDFGARVIAQMR
jgi:probable F420-dependent oxidoreductase